VKIILTSCDVSALLVERIADEKRIRKVLGKWFS